MINTWILFGWLVENLHENWVFRDKGGGYGMEHEFGVIGVIS